jgi:tRNA threonylcarbamoyl adenosine modification protein YeaZ
VLLALDTATGAVTLAVHDGERVRARAGSIEPRRHAEVLTPLVAVVLAEADVAGPALAEIVVGVGPGAYTGLRVGLATAAALGLAWGVPVTGACTLDALAAEAAATSTTPDGLLVVTDARRSQVFWARYDAAGVRRHGPAVAGPAAVPEPHLPAVGAGALAHPEVFTDPRRPEHPDAGWLAGGVLAGTVARLPVEPIYLRRPDVSVPGAPKPVLQRGHG